MLNKHGLLIFIGLMTFILLIPFGMDVAIHILDKDLNKVMIVIEDPSSINSITINDTKIKDVTIINDITGILGKYKTEKSDSPFPLSDENILYSIDYVDHFDFRHIIITTNKDAFIYESNDLGFFKIKNGEDLVDELHNRLQSNE